MLLQSQRLSQSAMTRWDPLLTQSTICCMPTLRFWMLMPATSAACTSRSVRGVMAGAPTVMWRACPLLCQTASTTPRAAEGGPQPRSMVPAQSMCEGCDRAPHTPAAALLRAQRRWPPRNHHPQAVKPSSRLARPALPAVVEQSRQEPRGCHPTDTIIRA